MHGIKQENKYNVAWNLLWNHRLHNYTLKNKMSTKCVIISGLSSTCANYQRYKMATPIEQMNELCVSYTLEINQLQTKRSFYVKNGPFWSTSDGCIKRSRLQLRMTIQFEYWWEGKIENIIEILAGFSLVSPDVLEFKVRVFNKWL